MLRVSRRRFFAFPTKLIRKSASTEIPAVKEFMDALHQLSAHQTRSPTKPPHAILCSAHSRLVIQGYRANTVIDGVPVDFRAAAKEVFERHMALKPFDVRNHLLCNFGVRGTGKTVQQCLNMWWFVEKDPTQRCAIEVTFNDDVIAYLAPKSMETWSQEQFTKNVALAVLARLIEFKAGRNFSSKESTKISSLAMENCRDLARKAVESMSVREGIPNSLVLARRAVGLKKDAPVLLCVDEIAKCCTSSEPPVKASDLLSTLTSVLDHETANAAADRQNQSFFLSVSTYGCLQLRDFATSSSRPIDLQPLPPIFPNLKTLNPVLQLLFGKQQRKLPSTSEALQLCRDLSELVMQSGGHPRRVQALLGHLSSVQLPQISRKKGALVKSVAPLVAKATFTCTQLMNAHIHLKSSAQDFISDANKNQPATRCMESLFYDTCNSFPFPQSTKDAAYHEGTLAATEEGYGNYFPTAIGGYAFLPYPTIEALAESYIDSVYRPFAKSMIDYVKSTDRDGKAFETCLAHCIAVYARYQSNPFKLRHLCRTHKMPSAGTPPSVLDVELMPFGTDVEATPNGTYLTCPSVNKKEGFLSLDPCKDIDAMQPGIYVPRHPKNLGFDAVGKFKRADHKGPNVTVFFQFKDWSLDLVGKDVSKKEHMFAAFRWGQQFVTCDKVPNRKSAATKLLDNAAVAKFYKDHQDSVAFLLFSANELKDFSEKGWVGPNVKFHPSTDRSCKGRILRECEGVTDLEHMKTWFPTAGYNLLAAHKLRTLWPSAA